MCSHVARAACAVLFACIMHSVLGGGGGVWGHATPGKLLPYESASEAIGDHNNHAQFMATGL